MLPRLQPGGQSVGIDGAISPRRAPLPPASTTLNVMDHTPELGRRAGTHSAPASSPDAETSALLSLSCARSPLWLGSKLNAAPDGIGSAGAGAGVEGATPPPIDPAMIRTCTVPPHRPAAKCQPSGNAGAAGTHGFVSTSARVTVQTSAPFLKKRAHAAPVSHSIRISSPLVSALQPSALQPLLVMLALLLLRRLRRGP